MIKLPGITTRRGFSLIELVIVISIVGILLALSLVGLSHAREAARKLTCQSRLKQVAIATSSFTSARGHLPEGSAPAHVDPVGDISCFARLLPYVEQSALAERVSRGTLTRFWPDPAPLGPATAYIELFNCPSDPIRPGNSFRACTGSSHVRSDAPWLGVTNERGNGAFPGGRRIALAEITDGLSYTVAFSEKRKSNTLSASFDPSTDVWLSGIANLVDVHVVSTDEVVHLCSLAPAHPTTYYGNTGYTWLFYGYFCTQYNHAVGPNAPMPDCSLYIPIDEGLYGVFTASSYHPGGINVAMLDGSVHFVTDRIDLEVWRALATRSGGEIFSF